MAQPVTRWGTQPSGRAASPPGVGAGPSSSIPSGSGSLLGSLVDFAKLGATVYDRVYGEGKAYKDLLKQRTLESIEQSQMSKEEQRRKQFEEEYQRQVEVTTGQKFSPELAQAFPQSREALARGGRPRGLPVGGEAPPGGAGVEGGGAPAASGLNVPQLAVKPWEAPEPTSSVLGRESAKLRGTGQAAIGVMPPGATRDRQTALSTLPQVPLPSQAAKTYGDIATAETAGTGAQKSALDLQNVQSAQQAMDMFRQTKDIRYLQLAQSYSESGRGQLADADRQASEAAITHLGELKKLEGVYAEVLKNGNPVEIERMAHQINVAQIGHARLTSRILGDEPTVMLYPAIATPGIVYGTNYASGNVRVPLALAQSYVAGKLSPGNPQDLLHLGGIKLGIQVGPGGQFSPEQATVLKQFISSYPGATAESVAEASHFIDSMTPQAPPGEAPPPPEEQPLEAQQRVAEVAQERAQVETARAPSKAAAQTLPPEGQTIERRWGSEPRRDPFMRGVPQAPQVTPQAPQAPGQQTLSGLIVPGRGAQASVPPERPAPSSPQTGPNVVQRMLMGLMPPPQAKAPVLISPREQPMIQAAAEANGVDPQFLTALRLAEAGGPGREFGVLSEPAPTYQDQARIAALSIAKSAARFRATGKEPMGPDGRYTPEFIQFFSARYAPTKGATNDPKGLNQNHARNLIALYGRLTGGAR